MRSKEKKVIVHLMGRFGNQLFQISAGLQFARKLNAILTLDITGIENGTDYIENREINLHSCHITYFQIFAKLLKRVLNLILRIELMPIKNGYHRVLRIILKYVAKIIVFLNLQRKFEIITPTEIGGLIAPTSDENLFMNGYFQSNSYVSDTETIRRIVISLAAKECEIRKRNISLLRGNENRSIAIHIRRGDYLINPHFGILKSDYFENALESLNRLIKFTEIYLYSDDIDVSKKLIPMHYRRNLVKRELCRHNSLCDLLEMIEHQNFIISNSTFSWWGAKLANAEPKIVIAPEPWFKDIASPNNLIPKEWILLKSVWDH